MTQSRRRRKPKPLTKAQRALQTWLDLQMADPVAAAQAFKVIGLHAGLVREIHEAEVNSVQLAIPQRRHLGDPRDINRLTGRSGTSDPDDLMIAIVDHRIFGHGHDPEGLQRIRQTWTNRIGREADWYGEGSQMLVTPEEWEPLAIRLGDLIGDQVAANALALCIIRHARMAYSPDEHWQRRRKNARDRWYRLAAWYVRVLDEQPTKPRSGQEAERYQTVGPDGERRLG